MKKIIHIDMDCFYAAVEMRDNPKLRNVPLAIGGSYDRRGVLCTANYIARKYGVRSAMSSVQALKLCPELVLVKPNMHKYKEASDIIKGIFSQYTDKVEPLSLDEAYLDVSESSLHRGSAQLLAEEIRQRIFTETNLHASAGVSCNKFLAKVASDWNKPNGLFVVSPRDVDSFVKELDVSKIPGVGKVTTEKLNSLKIFKCSDIRKMPLSFLSMYFGKFGKVLYDRAYGLDDREVQSLRIRKSLSVETTFLVDKSIVELEEALLPLESELSYRLEQLRVKKDEEFKVKQLFIKMKFSDFKTITSEEKKEIDFLLPLNGEARIDKNIHNFFKRLIQEGFKRSELDVRLLGLGVRFFTPREPLGGQLELFAS